MHLHSVYTSYILRPHSVRTFPPVTKKNPTSQCAQLDQFQAHKSTLAGRISYFIGIWVYLHTWGCPYQDAYVLGQGHPLQGVYLHSWGCAYQDTCVLGEGYPLQGVYLHSWGCAYQDTCVLGQGYPLQGVYLHSWGCAYQDICVLGKGYQLQGVYLHSWGCAYQDACILGEGINYRRCTFIAGGVHTMTHILPQLVKSI